MGTSLYIITNSKLNVKTLTYTKINEFLLDDFKDMKLDEKTDNR